MKTKTAQPPDLEIFFPGGSELARKLCQLDWSRTALGPPQQWPENLRAAVRLSLDSSFPVALFWGPEFILLYNEAYVPFLGSARHPQALGQPAKQCWGESWTTTGPRLKRLWRTAKKKPVEDAQFFVARKLPQQEVHVRFSFSPLLANDKERRLEGVLVLGTEITDQVVAGRRLETLRRLGRKSAPGLPGACAQVAQVLTENPHDIPFAAVYVVKDSGRMASLAATVRLAEHHSLPAAVSASDTPTERWPLGTVLRTGHKRELGGKPGAARCSGLWPESSSRAVVLPIPATPSTLAGLLVVGVSPRLVWDAEYQAFFESMADHIGTRLAEVQAAAPAWAAPAEPDLPTPRRSPGEQPDRVRTAMAAPEKAAQSLAAAAASETTNRAKDEFLAMLGHELRNALAPIRAALQLLRKHEIHSPEQDIIERQVGHIKRLIDDLLDSAQIGCGKLDLRKQRVELATVVSRAIEMSSPILQGLGHELEVRVAAQGLGLNVDSDRIAQSISNLLTNAAKYSTARSHILLVAERVSDKVRLHICDEGAGIAPDMLDKIFDLFVQQKQTLPRSHGGLGLGLSIVRSLLQVHGGTVSAKSEGLGKGSVFTVELPAVEESELADAAERLRLPKLMIHGRSQGVLQVKGS